MTVLFGLLLQLFISNSPKLAWDASPSQNVVGYNVYRSTTSGSYDQPVNPTPVKTTTYVDMGLKPGKYFWVIKAVGPKGELSGPSNELAAEVQDVTPSIAQVVK